MGLIKWQALALMITVITLAGCSKSAEEQQAAIQNDAAYNAQSLAAPRIVGNLPDGTPVKRVELQLTGLCGGCFTRHHYVYIVDGAKTQTVNWVQTEGKNQVQYTQATIQLPSTATPAEIIKMADEIKQKQIAAEKAEWERLNKAYGNNQ